MKSDIKSDIESVVKSGIKTVIESRWDLPMSKYIFSNGNGQTNFRDE